MPSRHSSRNSAEKVVSKSRGQQHDAVVLQRADSRNFIRSGRGDKSKEERLSEPIPPPSRNRKRKASQMAPSDHESSPEPIPQVNAKLGRRKPPKEPAARNVEYVIFGEYFIKTWYPSPYALDDIEPSWPSSTPAQAPNGSLNGEAEPTPLPNLYVCNMCFKYMLDEVEYTIHTKSCDLKKPPGRTVYERGAHKIFEVDGSKNKLYCQNLALFSKFFIGIKTVFYDIDNFFFYVVTDATTDLDFPMGFFSKEKVVYDNWNLACILIFPPWQRKGFGMLLIEFSYEISRRAGKLGTPERPLSKLGLRGYLAYWVATLIRFFRRILRILPPGTKRVESRYPPYYHSVPSPSPHTLSSNSSRFTIPFSPTFSHRQQDSFPPLSIVSSSQSSRSISVDEKGVNGSIIHMNGSSTSSSPTKRRKNNNKGWHGELVGKHDSPPIDPYDEFHLESMRKFVGEEQEDGSLRVDVVVQCTLGDISRATCLRLDDAIFALNEVGMLSRILQHKEGDEPPPGPLSVGPGNTVLITRKLVDQVAVQRNVKPTCIDLHHVRL